MGPACARPPGARIGRRPPGASTLVDGVAPGRALHRRRPAAYAGLVTGHVSAPPASAPPAVDLPALLPATLVAGEPDQGRGPRTVRDWMVDVLAFLLTVVGGLTLFATQQEVRRLANPLAVADLAVGAVCCTLLWWRRRWPVALAVLMTPAGAVSAASGLAVTVMVFTVAVHRRATVALLLGAANIATLPVFQTLRSGPDEPYWVNLTIGVLLNGVVLGWGMFARARRQLVTSLRDRAVRAEHEQQLRVDQARRLERTRIAREMHDVLAHRLSLLSVHAGALEFRTDAGPQQVAVAAGVIRDSARQALQELREVIGVLREDGTAPGEDGGGPAPVPAPDAPEPPQPGLDAIPALVAESTQAGVRVRYRCDLAGTGAGDGEQVPPSIARTAYRVVQEGLTNARKHAPGTTVEVVVTGGPADGLVVEVVNPVPLRPPGAPLPGAGLGLVGLHERVQLAGGRLGHGVTGGGRFVLRAGLPWHR